MDLSLISLPAGSAPVLIIFLTLLLHIIIPVGYTDGYCCDNLTLKQLKYRLNGFASLLVSIALFFLILPYEWRISLYQDYFTNLMVANVIGLLLSLFFFIRGGCEPYARCVTVDQLKRKDEIIKASSITTGTSHSASHILGTFFLGCEWNPRIFNIDIKMLLYAIGAIHLQLNLLSFMEAQRQLWDGVTSNAMITYVACFTWFLAEYMYCEHVHLYTYDLFAEKIGFKLVWGCLCFYPFFYCIGGHAIVTSNIGSDITPMTAVCISFFFITGWSITRGANMQKFYFRRNPKDTSFLFGLIQQETIPGTHILCSGYWGMSRHFNYCGEIIQGLALALPGLLVASSDSSIGRWVPFLYPLYYIILFITRQIDDDKVCQVKYGAKWDEYVKRVRYKIVPGVY